MMNQSRGLYLVVWRGWAWPWLWLWPFDELSLDGSSESLFAVFFGRLLFLLEE